MLAATRNYVAGMRGTNPRFVKHAANFFGVDRPYADFIEGILPGWAPNYKASRWRRLTECSRRSAEMCARSWAGERGEARTVVLMLAGYWPTPAVTEEEAVAWVRELGSASMRIAPQEARTTIDDMVHAGGRFRPRPGKVVAAVHTLRRYNRLMTPQPALPAAPVGF